MVYENIIDLNGRGGLEIGVRNGVGLQIALHLETYVAGGVIVNGNHLEHVEVGAHHYDYVRIGEPIKIINMLLFLVSDASSWITGQTYPVNRGLFLTFN